MTFKKPNVFRPMDDLVLQAAIAQLERDLDRCEALQEPQATTERLRALEQLDRARAELERRKA